MQPTLLILAAGMGSRYGGLKQIDVVGMNGQAIMDYSVFDAICSGFGKVVFVIRREIEASFKEFVENKFSNRIKIEYAFQEISMLPKGYNAPSNRTKPWGTAHAIWCARTLINESFAVINGDDFYGATGYRLIGNYLQSIDVSSSDFAMVGYLLGNTLSDYGSVSRGVCEIEKDLLKKIVERKAIEKKDNAIKAVLENGRILLFNGQEIVSLNFFGFTPVLFELLEKYFYRFLDNHLHNLKAEYFLPSVVDSIIAENLGTMRVFKSPDKWFGVTYKEDKTHVQRSIASLVEQGQYPRKF